MSVTIDLPNEVYELLEKQAQAHNLTVSEIIAKLIDEVESAHLSAAIEKMRAEGIIVNNGSSDIPPPSDFEPIKVQGKPVSEIIIEERR